MKQLFNLVSIMVLSILTLTSCSDDDTIIINTKEYPMKKVSLNTAILLESSKADIFGSKQAPACDFPELYNHIIPDEFNVFFVPTTGGDIIEFNNITEGQDTFRIPVREYRVVVTNSDKLNLGELPVYSDTLYLFGENTIDFSTTDTGEVLVVNDYAAVMVVDNTAITSTPVLDGQSLTDVGVYYNIYTRKNGTSHLGLNNNTEQTQSKFLPNQVYRYMICEEGTFTIVVDSDILVGSNDEIL